MNSCSSNCTLLYIDFDQLLQEKLNPLGSIIVPFISHILHRQFIYVNNSDQKYFETMHCHPSNRYVLGNDTFGQDMSLPTGAILDIFDCKL